MFTSYAMTKILNGMLQGLVTANPANLYFGGFTVSPDRTGGGGTESQYPGYGRVMIPALAGHFPAPVGSSIVSISNADPIVFPNPGPGTSENWTTIAHFDAASGGNMWAYYPLASILPIVPGVPAQIGIGELVGQMALSTNGGFTTYAAQNILNCMYAKKSILLGTVTTFYLAGFTSPPTISGGGNESAGGARVAIPIIQANWTGASGTNPVSSANANPLTFPTLNVIETWVGWALYDSPTPGTGNPWIFGLLATPINVNNNQPRFPIGSIQAICTGTV